MLSVRSAIGIERHPPIALVQRSMIANECAQGIESLHFSSSICLRSVSSIDSYRVGGNLAVKLAGLCADQSHTPKFSSAPPVWLRVSNVRRAICAYTTISAKLGARPGDSDNRTIRTPRHAMACLLLGVGLISCSPSSVMGVDVEAVASTNESCDFVRDCDPTVQKLAANRIPSTRATDWPRYVRSFMNVG